MIKNNDKFTLREYCKVLTYFYADANDTIINAGTSKIKLLSFRFLL